MKERGVGQGERERRRVGGRMGDRSGGWKQGCLSAFGELTAVERRDKWIEGRKEGNWVNVWKYRRDDGEWRKESVKDRWMEGQVMGKMMRKQADGRDIG